MNPTIYRIASRPRRVAACFVNAIAVGVARMGGELFSTIWNARGDDLFASKLSMLVFFLLLWLFSVVTRSPGAHFLLLEIRNTDLSELSLRQRVMRGLPYLAMLLAVAMPVPEVAERARAIVVFLGLCALIVDGLSLIATGRSLLDRCFRVTILALSLPDHLKPKFFGRLLS